MIDVTILHSYIQSDISTIELSRTLSYRIWQKIRVETHVVGSTIREICNSEYPQCCIIQSLYWSHAHGLYSLNGETSYRKNLTKSGKYDISIQYCPIVLHLAKRLQKVLTRRPFRTMRAFFKKSLQLRYFVRSYDWTSHRLVNRTPDSPDKMLHNKSQPSTGSGQAKSIKAFL